MTSPRWCGAPSARRALWGPHSFMIAAVIFPLFWHLRSLCGLVLSIFSIFPGGPGCEQQGYLVEGGNEERCGGLGHLSGGGGRSRGVEILQYLHMHKAVRVPKQRKLNVSSTYSTLERVSKLGTSHCVIQMVLGEYYTSTTPTLLKTPCQPQLSEVVCHNKNVPTKSPCSFAAWQLD